MVGFGVFDFLFIIDTIMESSLSSGWKHCLFVCLFRAVVRVASWSLNWPRFAHWSQCTPHTRYNSRSFYSYRITEMSRFYHCLIACIKHFKVAVVWFSTNNFWLIVGPGSFGSWNRGVEWECTTNQYLPNIAAIQDPGTRNWAVFSNLLGKYYFRVSIPNPIPRTLYNTAL